MKIDFHAHILPCVDHGSSSLEQSLRQLKLAQAEGVDCIVATSHFYSGRDDLVTFLSKRETAYQELCKANKTGIRIIPDAEVQISSGLEKLNGLERLSVGETDYILLEMPSRPWNERDLDTVLKVASTGKWKVIIAHIDRYPPREAEMLLGFGLVMQVNSDSVCNLLGRNRLKRLIEADQIQLLGSDAHCRDEGAYHRFQKALGILGSWGTHLMEHASLILQ